MISNYKDIIKTKENFNEFVNTNNIIDIDNFLSKLFYGCCDRLNSNYFRQKWIEEHSYIFDYIKNRYKDSCSIYESLYRMRYNLNDRPVCKICGGYTIFNKNLGFMDHCSAKCSANDPETKKKHIKTCLEKYGETNYSKTNECKNRVKTTCLEKYGFVSPSSNEDVKKKSRETCLKRYGKEYVTQTEQFKNQTKTSVLSRYGVEYITQYEHMKQKSKQTCLRHYGTQYYLQTEECVSKRKESVRNKKGYYGSKKENALLNQLMKYFTDIKREYKSEKYPYHCDFYIPSIDLYIEYNGMWTHNNHPYDENSEYDKEILNLWIEKSKTSKYYKRAIDIWTIEDVNKRKIALENNLNWIEGYTISEILDKLKKYI